MAHNGIVYLLHFERSYRHARHYIGFTQNLEQRLAEHRAGRGSALVAAAIADGIDFQLAAIGTTSGACTAERTPERGCARFASAASRPPSRRRSISSTNSCSACSAGPPSRRR
jgi:predicted GIY-YIG superfamily endonuclease